MRKYGVTPEYLEKTGNKKAAAEQRGEQDAPDPDEDEREEDREPETR